MTHQSNSTKREARTDPGHSRAIAYLRVSTAGQEEGYGLDVQRQRIEEYANAEGVEVVDVVTETASGGVRDGEVFSWEHRPALLDIRERLDSGEFDIILVARYDRLSRDHATLIAFERHAQKHGVRIVSVAEERDTNGDTALGRFIRTQLAAVAELERAMIRDRLDAGKARARASGRRAEGRPPYGYSTSKGALTPDETTAAVARRIFQLAAAGATPGEIARHLGGTPTPQGGKAWTRWTVATILGNPTYTGEAHGARNVHPAIVSKRLWNQAQRALAARAKK